MKAIGETTWFRGDEVTITSEPYILHGGEFQDAVTADGRTVTMATAAQREADAMLRQSEYREAQAGFSRLHRS